MEIRQAAEQVGRQVLVSTAPRWPVGGLGDGDVRRAIEEAVEGDPTLGPSERRACAGVDAEAEAEVLAGIAPVDVELVGILEEPWVTVGRAREQEHAGAGGDVDAGERGAGPGHAE